MRRDRSADNGLTEFMVTSLIERARTLGVDRLSLNFAMFRAAFEQGDRIGAGPVLRLWRRLPGHRLAVVAARVALPREREVPAHVDAALPVLPGRPRPAPDRHRLRHRRGLPQRAEPAGRCNAAAWHRRADGAPARHRAVVGQHGCARPSTEDPVAAQLAARPRRAAGAGPRAARPSTSGCAPRAIDPYPVGYPRTASLARGPRAVRQPAARRRDRRAGLGHRPRPPLAQPRRPVLRRAAGRACPAAGHAGGRPAGARASLRDVDARSRSGRPRRGRRGGRHVPARRAVRARRRLGDHGQVPASAAGQAPAVSPTRRRASGSATSTW